VLLPVLVQQLQKLNPGVVDQCRAEDVARAFCRVKPNVEGNLAAWEYLKGLKTVFVETERRERNVRLLDLPPRGRRPRAAAPESPEPRAAFQGAAQGVPGTAPKRRQPLREATGAKYRGEDDVKELGERSATMLERGTGWLASLAFHRILTYT
jgi:hypothetical protein